MAGPLVRHGSSGGRFVRNEAQFRNWVTPDGAPGPSGEGGFKAEAGRYHLYVSLACPWAHRTLIFRALKGLEDVIGVSVVHWRCARRAGPSRPRPGATGDDALRRLPCTRSTPAHGPTIPAGSPCRCCGTSSAATIVNNEFSEIIRMLNSAFDGVGAAPGDYYPEPLRPEIDADQRARLRHGQQRRLPGRASPRRRRPTTRRWPSCSPSLDWLESACSPAALPRRRPAHRGRLAAVHDAGALRPGLPRPLQVQPAPARRLPELVGLHARALPWPGVAETVELRPHQAPLLRQPRDHQPDRHRAEGPADRLRGAARRSGAPPPEALAGCPAVLHRRTRSIGGNAVVARRLAAPRPRARAPRRLRRRAATRLGGRWPSVTDRWRGRSGARWSAAGSAASSTPTPSCPSRRSPPPTQADGASSSECARPRGRRSGRCWSRHAGRWSVEGGRIVTSDVDDRGRVGRRRRLDQPDGPGRRFGHEQLRRRADARGRRGAAARPRRAPVRPVGVEDRSRDLAARR